MTTPTISIMTIYADKQLRLAVKWQRRDGAAITKFFKLEDIEPDEKGICPLRDFLQVHGWKEVRYDDNVDHPKIPWNLNVRRAVENALS